MGSVSVFALGGLGEVGMNCLAIEQRGEVMLVDCGVTFDHRGLGVDVVHPDFSALEPYRGKIAGLFITHGHEDHIGAIPYFLERFDVPVWAPPHALALIKARLAENEVERPANSQSGLKEANVRGLYRVGSFVVEPIRVTHSIADATALAIKTDAGVVLHTGDFKFDNTPPDGEAFDIDRIDELGEAGVALLLSDSTNIDAAGETGSERGVGDALHRITAKASGAVVVAMFASNVHRLRMIGEIARHTKRKIVLLGRSVENHANAARETHYLDWPSDIVHPADRAKELPKNQILAIASGTQGEWRGALSRIARGDHPNFELAAGDTVVLSSRTIPGNDLNVYAVMGHLLRRGVELKTWINERGVHVSGHAHRQEQKRMLELARPKAFVPVHGTLHHLTRHADLAREVGVQHTCVLENGDVAELDGTGVKKSGKVQVGRVHVAFGRAIPPAQLRERVILAGEGVVAVTIVVRPGGAPDVRVATRGTIDEAVEASVLEKAKREAARAFAEADTPGSLARDERVRLAVRHVFREAIGFKPITIVTIVE
jgi:ribonuclease J